VSARIATSAVGAALALVSPSVAVASGPSPAQISAAIQRAERSKQLWATVNVCTTDHHKGQLGIRGQMPSLGFLSQMYMTFEVTYKPPSSSHFKRLRSTKATVSVGQASKKVLQVGRTYPFQTSQALLAGRVTFEWRRSGKVLGRTTRRTTGHHTHVDFADPPGFSQPFCRLT
jgi:hypothetical protein